MNKFKELINSVPVLLALSAMGIGLSFLLISPISTKITTSSVSVVSNFYMVGTFMFLLVISSLAQTFLLVVLIWGKPLNDSETKDSAEQEDPLLAMRRMKATGTKKSFIYAVFLAINIFAFDYVGSGILVTKSYKYHVLTKLRSSVGQERANAVTGAIQLVGDSDVAESLRNIMNQKGEAREWAAYASGIRRDKDNADSMVNLLKTGNPRERAAAAVALARLEDNRLVRLAIDAWPHMGDLKTDLIIALGMVGKKRISEHDTLFSKHDLALAGNFFVDLLKDDKIKEDKVIFRLLIWALNKFESPEGLEFLESILSLETDTQTVCMAIEALGNIGAADSSYKIVAYMEKADLSAYCNEMVAADFTGGEVLLCTNANLIAKIIYELANIGDHRIVPAIAKVAEDERYSDSVRGLAREFVFQMQYRGPR